MKGIAIYYYTTEVAQWIYMAQRRKGGPTEEGEGRGDERREGKV